MGWLKSLWDQICSWGRLYVVEPILGMDARDVADILLLAVLLFLVYRFFRRRRAGRVMLGLVLVVLGSLVALALRLPTLSYIVRLFSAAAFFIVVVIFQPEIRDALEKLGNTKLLNPRSDTLPRSQYGMAKQVTGELVDAVMQMSETSTGALIVLEGLTKLGDYVETGRLVDARVTSHLIRNIFFDKAPLHDGAMIIRNMRIYCASCALPSTVSKQDFGSMGMRHRAAIGVTEVSDALVIVVSEQTGIVSVAEGGKLLRGVDAETLRDILMTYLAGNQYLRTRKSENKKRFFEQFETPAQSADPLPVEPEEDASVEELPDESPSAEELPRDAE